MKLELVSFKLCPFVQRSVITLLYKNVPFDITHIDLSNPPQWFKERSPFGQVPILIVDDKHVIFESSVINEFLDESTPGSLLPEDILQRALDRSWIDFGSACLMDLSGLMHGSEQEKYEKNLDALRTKLSWLEKILSGSKYFNGPDISLVDFAYAPLFMRMDMIGLAAHLPSLKKVDAWSARLLELSQVRNSVVPDFNELLFNMIKKHGSYAAKVLKIQ